MRNKLLGLIFMLLLLAASMYLLLPSPDFPDPPPGALRSAEPADTESTYRRAYFTNLTREEIMKYYWQEFGGWGVKLILPPEDSYSVIRDQARSSYLEEIVHPGRETLYVNAYVPTSPTDQINRNGVHYLNKVTVRMVPSNPIARMTVLALVALSIYLLAYEYGLVKK